MKKIGLVGGTGPESTVMYYKKLNSEIDLLTMKNTCLISRLKALILEERGNTYRMAILTNWQIIWLRKLTVWFNLKPMLLH